MASNVEGEALKRMSGASAKPGGVSNVVKAMVADKWLRGGRDSGGGGKTAADWENEEVAKQHEFGRQTTRRDWTHEDSQNKRFKQVGYGADGGVNTAFYPAGTTPRQKPAANAKSGGGQGTSGNTKGSQFKGAVGAAAKDVAVKGAGVIAGAAAGAVTKNPKVAAAAATLGSEAASTAINAVSKRRSGKSSAV